MIENYNPFTLKGKTVLITGASSGIGLATAIECSKLGASLIVTGRNKERLNSLYNRLDRSEGQQHKYLSLDLTSQDEIKNLVNQVDGLSGIVFCAGKVLSRPAQLSSKGQIDDIFGINFSAPVELLSSLYKKKKLNKHSSVVAISALSGVGSFRSLNSLYGASKAALSAFMKFCALEFSSRDIRVNCVCPGMVDTPLIHNGAITEEQLKADEERYPMKRYGKPEDIAFMIIYLLSEASSWVTGQNFIIDGGKSLV